jgi:hypothetical protein
VDNNKSRRSKIKNTKPSGAGKSPAQPKGRKDINTMKHTKANVIKLLKAMYEHYHEMARIVPEDHRLYINKAIEVSNAISFLTDKEYFEKFCEIYGITE